MQKRPHPALIFVSEISLLPQLGTRKQSILTRRAHEIK
jgi:hypothetical protein